MGDIMEQSGVEPRSGCAWTYAEKTKTLTITRRPERADSDAIWRIVAFQLHLAGVVKEITVVRGDMTLQYRPPDDPDGEAPAERCPTPSDLPPEFDGPGRFATLGPDGQYHMPESLPSPSPIPADGRRHPAPHHCRKRRKARHAKG